MLFFKSNSNLQKKITARAALKILIVLN